MDFSFTEEQERMREHLTKLLDEVCPPEYTERCDNNATPPREAFQALAEHGWFGLILPVEYGGSGGSAIDLAILLEETGLHCEDLASWLFRTLTYGGYAMMKHGTQAQKEEFLPKVLRGEISFCFGLTEPDSGSDAAALTTRATAVDGGYVINGLALEVDRQGAPHIVYNRGQSNANVTLQHTFKLGNTWSTKPIKEPAGVGRNPSLVVDGQGHASVCYRADSGLLKYARVER